MENNFSQNTSEPEIEKKIANINAGFLPKFKGGNSIYWALFLFLVIVLLSLALILQSIQLFLAVPVLALLIVPLSIYYQQKNQRQFMRKFASLYGFRYQVSGSADKIDSPYFKMGHNRSLSDVVSGTIQNYPLRFFNFHCLWGYGDNQDDISFTAAQIGLKAASPHIFLEASHHFWAENTSIALKQSAYGDAGKELIKLEGDFDKYFTLHAQKGREIETLQIFSPDIMRDLIEHSKNFSLEFYGPNMYIYSRKVITSGKDLCELYDLAKFLIAKLAPELERLK